MAKSKRNKLGRFVKKTAARAARKAVAARTPRQEVKVAKTKKKGGTKRKVRRGLSGVRSFGRRVGGGLMPSGALLDVGVGYGAIVGTSKLAQKITERANTPWALPAAEAGIAIAGYMLLKRMAPSLARAFFVGAALTAVSDTVSVASVQWGGQSVTRPPALPVAVRTPTGVVRLAAPAGVRGFDDEGMGRWPISGHYTTSSGRYGASQVNA